jgi:hypothetical protein
LFPTFLSFASGAGRQIGVYPENLTTFLFLSPMLCADILKEKWGIIQHVEGRKKKEKDILCLQNKNRLISI